MHIDLIVYDQSKEGDLASAILDYMNDYQKEMALMEELRNEPPPKTYRWYEMRPVFVWLLGVAIGLIIASSAVYTRGVCI